MKNLEGSTSCTDESPAQLHKLQSQLISQILVECVKNVRLERHNGGMAKHIEVLKEFYRIVKDATDLIHLCCRTSCFNVAMILVDGTEAFALRISELIWCTNVILKTQNYSTIPSVQMEESNWKARLESAACQDQRMLRSRLEELLVEQSRLETESCKLARVLLKRLDGSGNTNEGDTDKNPTYPDLKELWHKLRRGCKQR